MDGNGGKNITIDELLRALGPSGVGTQPTPNSQQMLNATLLGVQAINNLTLAIKAAFPQGNTLTTSGGSASGQYLVVTINGTAYKIELRS